MRRAIELAALRLSASQNLGVVDPGGCRKAAVGFLCARIAAWYDARMKTPKFSLKLLLISVTILAAIFGWFFSQLNVVRQRRAFLNELSAKWQAADHGKAFSIRVFVLEYEVAKDTGWDVSNARATSVPVIRRFFGDRPYLFLALPEDVDQQFIDRAIDLFPEAVLRRLKGANELVEIRK
jgi:hypothetical protein